ncbi:dienelactone hydrolase family protein [Venturia nashicola]|uniref:Dienelactone hydrolase family protein n=1 Tax=Venturia nashicola TaxID=86259 RepID=A0A4Z1PNG5_9PEZI|nr:dienelactone hydrolase family protein [Venturia nashicola]
MVRITSLTIGALVGLSYSSSVSSKDEYAPDTLAYEHPGSVFRQMQPSCGGGVLHDGNSTGEYRDFGGINTYLSYPPSKKTDVAILYLTDIFGLPLVNNRLLGDSLAKAGPDLFKGDAIPADALNPGSTFNMSEWRTRHTVAMADAIVESTIKTMRSELGVKKIGAVGYCYGGKYIARFLAAGKGLDAGFTAHPSSVELAEWDAVSNPLSIAYGELDALNNASARSATEASFIKGGKTYQTSLYAAAEHGFAVRTNLTDPRKRFAQESAYVQAVRWFDAWIK